jgi:two-component system NtrC family sensor kinase
MEGRRWAPGLEVKLLLTVCLAVVVSGGLLAWVTVRHAQTARVDLMIRAAGQISDTVKRSIHHAMLANRWADAFDIMKAIGTQEEVRRVRVFSKEGAILFSTESAEVGRTVDRRAESCHACHAAERPLERLPTSERARIFADRDGSRLLGTITPLYNEPGCSAGCHVHPPTRRVLGVLDITISLARVDAEIAAVTRRSLLLGAAALLVLAAAVTLFVHRDVIRPVRELVAGTRAVAQGELTRRIPVAAGDELGALAASFNEMTESLAHSRAALEGMVDTLEQRVAERTRELALAQEQLIRTEKLASLGKLSASIAHEINNPLSGILTYTKLISRRLRTGPPDADEVLAILQQLALVERETQRCSAIVRNLLDFARQREPAFTAVELPAVLGEAVSLLATRMAIQQVAFTQDVGTPPPVWADFGQLRQALLNILVNAVEAMPIGGPLAVTARELPAGADDERRSGQRFVELAVTDRGGGISPEHLPRIFDPFFSTKERGTGLGLSVAYGIVERHGGTIVADSRAGIGTTIRLRLPVAPDPA